MIVPGYPDVCWIARCGRIDYLDLHEALARSRSRSTYASEARSSAYEYATCRDAARSDIGHL